MTTAILDAVLMRQLGEFLAELDRVASGLPPREAVVECFARGMAPTREIPLLARMVEYHRYRGAAAHLRERLEAEHGHRYRSAPLPASAATLRPQKRLQKQMFHVRDRAWCTSPCMLRRRAARAYGGF